MLTLARRWSLDCAQYTAPGGDAVPCVPSRARVFVAGLLAQAGFPPAVWPASGKKSPAEALDAMRKGGPVRARRDAITTGDLPVCWPRGYSDANTEVAKAVDPGNVTQPVQRSRALSFSPMRGRWERTVHPCERTRGDTRTASVH
ncbi:unnamed protein product [Cladocopium goreaui]|uniref:Uncharacterized protein n=1 Tax=Cladocopium goreaui TaxID=2562237 RepID=A0A9P1CQ21_9DINO|nr:unnamed protein product [Cladocopium goreaui]